MIEQIKSLLAKLVPVHKVQDLTIEGPHVERELALVKVTGDRERLIGALRIADYMHARLVDSAPGSLVLEATGTSDELDAFIELVQPVEVSRAGVVAIGRGSIILEARPADRPPPSSARPVGREFSESGESTMRVYYDADADLNLIKGKKVAVIGYGSQGFGHSNNLKESGVAEVAVALKETSATRKKVEAAGLRNMTPAEAARWADVVMVLVPTSSRPTSTRTSWRRT